MKRKFIKPSWLHFLPQSVCFLFVILFANLGLAQNNSGKDFWFAQTPNSNAVRYDTARIAILVSNPGQFVANVVIKPQNPAKAVVTAAVAPGTVQEFFFSSENSSLQATGKLVNNVYHITSDRSVVAYGFTPWLNAQSNDASLLLPTHALGKKYMPGSYINALGNTNFSFYGFIATENATSVKIFDRANVLVETVVLQQGEYYQRMTGKTVLTDVTGWYIEADKNISMFAGNQSTSIGNSTLVADHIEEQLLPIETLASTYIASPTNTRPINCTTCAPDAFRYVATEDGTAITTSVVLQAQLVSAPVGSIVPSTAVTLNSVTPVMLNKGQFLDFATNLPHVVTGTKPFYAYQYLISERASGATGTPLTTLTPAIGDPDMMNIPVVDQFQFNYNFIIPSTFVNDVISIVVPSGATFLLDGSVINLNWKNAGTVNGINYVAATYFVTDGAHKIVSDKKFGLIVSGFGAAASYSYIGGSGLEPINAGCITGGPYQALGCDGKPLSIQLNGVPTCEDGSAPTMIRWTSPDGVVFTDPNIANPVATVPGYGTYNITMTVTCGATSISCSSEIIAQQPLLGCAALTTPPVLKAPPAIVVPSNTGQNFATGVALGVPVYTAVAPLSLVNNGPSSYPMGSTIITWTLSDANSITVSDTQRVTVVGPPTIIAPLAITTGADAGQSFASGVTLGTATYTAWGHSTLTSDAPPTFPMGNTTVTWTIKDEFGRTASATQLVTVVSSPPTITAPDDITVTAGYDGFATGLILGSATHTSTVDPTTVSNDAPAAYSIGSVPVKWTVTDGAGRTASDVQVITVLAPLPVISPLADINVSNDPGVSYATLTLAVPALSAVGPYTITSNAPATFPVGTTVVRWTLTDKYGAQVIAAQNVIVTAQMPTITAPPAVSIEAGYNGLATGVALGNATHTASVNPSVVTNDAPASFPIGTTTVTWTVTDGLNRTATDVQTITVTAPSPTLAPPADITTVNDAGMPNATGVILGAPAVQAVGPYTLTNDAPSVFPVGTTTVTWTLTDKYGVTTTTTQKVTVTAPLPTIIAPAAVSVNANAGQNYATGVALGTATYSVSVNPPVLSNNAPAQLPVGTTQLTWTIKDGLGRTATATQNITVVASACVFNCTVISIPTDITPTGGNPNNLYLGYGAQSTKLQVNVPSTGGPFTFQWTGTGLSNTTSAAPIFTPPGAGTYVFGVKVKNSTGCTSTASISICVRDARALDKNGRWDGKKVIVCHLPPGNPANVQMIDVSVNAVSAHVPLHGGDGLGNSCTQTCAAPSASRNTLPSVLLAEAFDVNVYPNPASGFFTLKVKSDDTHTAVSVRILDAFGRTVQMMDNVPVGKALQFGSKFASGAYYAEVIQGEDRKMIPLMKAK